MVWWALKHTSELGMDLFVQLAPGIENSERADLNVDFRL